MTEPAANVFPLFKLPYLSALEVLRSHDIYDRISFSEISKRCKRFVRILKTPVKFISLYPVGRQLIKFEPMEEDWCYLHFNDNTFLVGLRIELEYLMDLFGCSINKIFFDCDFLPDQIETLDFGVTHCEVLGIIGKEEIKNEAMVYIMNKFSAREGITVDVPISKTFPWDPANFKSKQVVLWGKSCQWVTKEQLFKFKCTRLKMTESTMKTEDVVDFVTRWYHSDDKEFEYLYVNFEDPINENDTLLDHLNPMPFDKTQRNASFELRHDLKIDCSKGLDILRADGLLATCHKMDNSFVFHVWHDRFPQLSDDAPAK